VVRKEVKNHQAVAHAETTLKKIRMVRGGQELNGAHKVFGAAYRLLDPDGQSPTVTRSGFRDFIHPSEDRLCTVRELARLQTFPDAYEFKGRRCDTYAKSRYVTQTQHEQLGNAVPPLLARALAFSIRRQLFERQVPEPRSHTPGILRVIETLDGHYPEDNLGNKENPLDELIYILISRRAAERQYVPVYTALHRRFRRWRGLLGANPQEVSEILRPAGLASQRTKAIIGCVAAIHTDFGDVSLSRLRRWSNSRAYNYLRTLPGVNDKVAKCVLGYSLHRDVLPVDSHTLRVSTRLGIIPQDTSYFRAPALLEASVPEGSRLRFHVLCVLHGRAVCRSRRPDCSRCPLRRLCPSAPDYLE